MICSLIACLALTTAPMGYIDALRGGRISINAPTKKVVSQSSLNDLVSDMRFNGKRIKETAGDYWHADFDSVGGDCEDYALTIRKKLTSMGYNGGYVATVQNNTHAVLVVPTDQGLYIVDMLKQRPQHINQYNRNRINKIEQYGQWFTI